MSRQKRTRRRDARAASIDENTQTKLLAADEVLKAAPPNPRCSSPARHRYGLAARRTLYGSPNKSKPLRGYTCCVRFTSGRPGLPHLQDGTREPRLRRKSAMSPVSEFPPGSAPRRAGLPHTSVTPAAAAARHNCGPHTFFRGPTDELRATGRSAPGDGSA